MDIIFLKEVNVSCTKEMKSVGWLTFLNGIKRISQNCYRALKRRESKRKLTFFLLFLCIWLLLEMRFCKTPEVVNTVINYLNGNVSITYFNHKYLAQEQFNKDNCISGHIYNQNLPICAPDGCLRTISGSTSNQPKSVTPEIMSKIFETHGWTNPLFLGVNFYLTSMQWSFGIYGSVGEIGVYYGSYASMLAVFIDTEYGERFFVCDIFDDPEEQSKFQTEEGRRDKFEEAMNNIGFSIEASEDSHRVRMYDGSSLHLNKRMYISMDLSAFRFYSIDGNHHFPYVIHDLQHVVCVLRDGGIIALDDFANPGWPEVQQATQAFFRMYGSGIVVPFLVVQHKLFLCTASWHDKYMNYIRDNQKLYIRDVRLNLCERTFEIADRTTITYFNSNC